MFGVWSSSAKTYVFGALVACTTKSEAARGDVADLLRARKGSSALRALVCSIVVYDCDRWVDKTTKTDLV